MIPLAEAAPPRPGGGNSSVRSMFALWNSGLLIVALLLSCASAPSGQNRLGQDPREKPAPGTGAPAGGAAPAAPFLSFSVRQAYPHDPQAFTQGLVFDGEFLYESTGLRGRSSVRKVELETGQVLQKRAIAPEHFGEGVTLWEDRLIQLTWLSGRAFSYDRQSFRPLGEFRYLGEGWGLTHDGQRLIMSDGSSRLTFRAPKNFAELGRVEVRDRGLPVEQLNELEYIRGEVFANVWSTDLIARISPQTGQVTGWLDLQGLRDQLPPGSDAEALNGIACDPAGKRVFVTGKLWPRLFEITLSK